MEQNMAPQEIKNDLNNTISQEFVQKIHEKNMCNGYNNNNKKNEILSIIGGIDEVLTCYLSNNNDLLNQNQIETIYELISTSKSFTQKKIKKNDNSDNEQQIECGQCHFYENDNYLYSLFGEQKANKLVHILNSQITKTVVLVGFIIFGILVLYKYIRGDHYVHQIIQICFISFSSFIAIPYLVILMLSANKFGVRLILTSFEFWLKFIYMVIFALSYYWMYRVVFLREFDSNNLSIALGISATIVGILAMSVILLFDALHVNTKSKIVISTLAALFFSIFTILESFTYKFSNKTDDSIIYMTSNLRFSLRSTWINAVQLVSLFMWKQAYLTWKRSKSNQSTVIKIAPYIKWHNDKKEIDKLKKEENKDKQFENHIYDNDIDDNDAKEIEMIIAINPTINVNISNTTDELTISNTYDMNGKSESINNEKHLLI